MPRHTNGGLTAVDPHDTILDAFLALPAEEAKLLHKLLGKILSWLHNAEALPPLAEVFPTERAPWAHTVSTSEPFVPAGPTEATALRQRRRRRTRAEMNAAAGPARATVEVEGDDPGLPAEEIGG